MKSYFRITRIVLLLGMACSAGLPVSAADTPGQLRSFPGAEGFGAFTPGGRGGKVYVVTTLEDYADKRSPIKGSFRQAVQAKEPRIVVFAVSGTIHLKDRIRIRDPYITIAGQTAPGDGICVADHGATVATHDVIVRHMRFRHGDLTGDEGDSFSFRSAQNVIVDHCSISWGLDECFSFTKAMTNVTAQWCIISEGLNAKHHGYGSLIAPEGGDSQMSFHHNLYAMDYGRTPRASSRGFLTFLFDFRNNVIFDWGTGYDWGTWAVYNSDAQEEINVNFIGNYSIAGLDTSIEATHKMGFHPHFDLTTQGYREAAISSRSKGSRIYESSSKIDSNVNGKLDGVDNGWAKVSGIYTKMDAAFPVPAANSVKTESADEAYLDVLAHAGAEPWHRDAVDIRVVAGVRDQSGRVINSQKDVGGWPELKSQPAPLDSDGDGIPDEWEKAHGLNPNDPSDASKPSKDGSGYSNIEVYINSLASGEH